jgi:hypothetical protein
MRFNFETRTLIHPPAEVAGFVDGLIRQMIEKGQYLNAPDRRAETRHTVAIQVSAMPLGSDLQPIGDPFIATTKDISNASLTLIHFEALTAPLLAIQLKDLGGSVLNSAVEVIRCQPVGPYFEIVGRYVTKIYDPKPKPQEAPPLVSTAPEKPSRRWLSFKAG